MLYPAMVTEVLHPSQQYTIVVPYMRGIRVTADTLAAAMQLAANAVHESELTCQEAGEQLILPPYMQGMINHFALSAGQFYTAIEVDVSDLVFHNPFIPRKPGVITPAQQSDVVIGVMGERRYGNYGNAADNRRGFLKDALRTDASGAVFYDAIMSPGYQVERPPNDDS